jgi:VanZ family protein
MIENVEEASPLSIIGGFLKYWSPPIIWMSAIFFFSTDIFSGNNTGSPLWEVLGFIYPGLTHELFNSIHFYLRKAGHFSVYAILALLLFRGFRSGAVMRWRWNWALASLLVVVFYAALDEYHQTFTRHRSGSIYDSMIDASGGVAAMALLWLLSHSAHKGETMR